METLALIAIILGLGALLFVVGWYLMPSGWLTHAVNAIAGAFWASEAIFILMAEFEWGQVLPPGVSAMMGLGFHVLASLARRRGSEPEL